MTAANARMREAMGLVAPISLEAMEHVYTHLVNCDPTTDLLLAERSGEVVGYARVSWADLTDGSRSYSPTVVVAPEMWGAGLTDALVAWSLDRLVAIAATHPDDRLKVLTAFTFDGMPEHDAALEARGLVAVRWGADMVRPTMDALPAVSMPPGYELRTPAMSEMRRVHDMNIVAFREHFAEVDDPDNNYAEWVESPEFRLDLVAVAWNGGEPVACSAGQLQPGPDGSVRAYIATVDTHPDHRRRGLAGAVLAEVLHRCRAEGATSAWLGVDQGNAQKAYELYERAGFRIESTSTTRQRWLTGPKATA